MLSREVGQHAAVVYDHVDTQEVPPGNLFAAEPEAREVTEQLIRDAGFDPVYMGDIDPGARLLEDSVALLRAVVGQIGPYFYRYDVVGGR